MELQLLTEKLKKDYPDLRFKEGRKFAFRPPRTIVIGPEEPGAELLLLHEVGHAISGHRDFDVDVKRLKMEVEAWEKARDLANNYGVEFSEEVMEAELDSYRDWLHQKSRCPACGLTRFETPDGQYHCPRCESL
ncbi:TFIIB-type zinc finger domain-containing protein [Candidatus Saccharibacteria bacterium]|nr:TFIIB-type zinc finger domain-containing protein [Candidatus Saccharibacteria bacterium]